MREYRGRERFRDRQFMSYHTNSSERFRNQHKPYQNYFPGSTSFFFTNFPEQYGHEDLWKVFLKWGRVVDVFIAPRTDRFGKKFGFVRYTDVQNTKALEAKLDSLWLGSYKLRVNLPMFQRNSQIKEGSNHKVIKDKQWLHKKNEGEQNFVKAVVGGGYNGIEKGFRIKITDRYHRIRGTNGLG